MTGPEHYARAEELVLASAAADDGSVEQTAIVAEAQVHALLALTAATIEPRNPVGRAVREAWQQITSPPPGDEQQ